MSGPDWGRSGSPVRSSAPCAVGRRDSGRGRTYAPALDRTPAHHTSARSRPVDRSVRSPNRPLDSRRRDLGHPSGPVPQDPPGPTAFATHGDRAAPNPGPTDTFGTHGDPTPRLDRVAGIIPTAPSSTRRNVLRGRLRGTVSVVIALGVHDGERPGGLLHHCPAD